MSLSVSGTLGSWISPKGFRLRPNRLVGCVVRSLVAPKCLAKTLFTVCWTAWILSGFSKPGWLANLSIFIQKPHTIIDILFCLRICRVAQSICHADRSIGPPGVSVVRRTRRKMRAHTGCLNLWAYAGLSTRVRGCDVEGDRAFISTICFSANCNTTL